MSVRVIDNLTDDIDDFPAASIPQIQNDPKFEYIFNYKHCE